MQNFTMIMVVVAVLGLGPVASSPAVASPIIAIFIPTPMTCEETRNAHQASCEREFQENLKPFGMGAVEAARVKAKCYSDSWDQYEICTGQN